MSYDIIRFRKGKPNRVIKRGLSKEEAIMHCNSPMTKGKDWFDGFHEV